MPDESAELLRKLGDLSPCGIAIHIEGRIVFLNRAGAAMLGCRETSEGVGKPVLSFVHPDSVELIASRMRRVREEGRPVPPIEQRLLCMDGRILEAEAAAAPIRYMGNDAVLVVFRDMTEQKRKERALRESDDRFRALFDASLDTIAVNRASDGRYLDVNEEFLRVTGYARSEVVGKTPRELAIWARREDFRTARVALRKQGFIRNLESEFRRKDGSRLPTLFSAAVTEIGAERCIISIARDITERKEMEKELIAARDRALEASRLKSAFLANMSHEVRTPLNVITGYCTLLGEAMAERGDDTLTPLAEAVERASRRLVGTVQGTLDLAALESGSFGASPESVDLTECVSAIVGSFAVPAHAKGLGLAFEAREAVPRVFFDRYSLTQALSHIVENAVKFTERGFIRVIVYRDAIGRPCIVVRDTGVGIDPGFLAKAFHPFSQEDSGYTRRFEGVGLGLALARRFLETQGASLAIRSTKGIGTTVRVRFPLPGGA